jgi:hypothetical protein
VKFLSYAVPVVFLTAEDAQRINSIPGPYWYRYGQDLFMKDGHCKKNREGNKIKFIS